MPDNQRYKVNTTRAIMAVAAMESAAPSAFLSISCWSDMFSSVKDGFVFLLEYII
jgi:hypothetical protein